jgi:hypothetical protein
MQNHAGELSRALRACACLTCSGIWLSIVLHGMSWYHVVILTGRVEILTSPSLSSRPFLTPAFSAVFPTKIPNSPLLLHLYHESLLLTLLGTLTTNFRRARQTSAFDASQLQGLQADLHEYRIAALAWQNNVEKDNRRSASHQHSL